MLTLIPIIVWFLTLFFFYINIKCKLSIFFFLIPYFSFFYYTYIKCEFGIFFFNFKLLIYHIKISKHTFAVNIGTAVQLFIMT